MQLAGPHFGYFFWSTKLHIDEIINFKVDAFKEGNKTCLIESYERRDYKKNRDTFAIKVTAIKTNLSAYMD